VGRRFFGGPVRAAGSHRGAAFIEGQWMSSIESADQPPSALLPQWYKGTLTLYLGGRGLGKVRRVAFPCTKENQLVFQRLLQTQAQLNDEALSGE